MTVAAPAFYATLEMLQNGSFDQSKFDAKTHCTYLSDSTYVPVLDVHPESDAD